MAEDEVTMKMREHGLLELYYALKKTPPDPGCGQYFKDVLGGTTLRADPDTTIQAIISGPNIGEKHIQPFGYDRLAEAFRLFPGEVPDTYNILGEAPHPPAAAAPAGASAATTARAAAKAPTSPVASKGAKRKRVGK